VIATIPSATLLGVDGRPVFVEVHISNGLPTFNMVGLPDAACRESRDRVRAAMLSSGLPWHLRRTTVNLAPSGVRKGGAGLDLPIAIGLLVAGGDLDPQAVSGCAFLGELGLDGSIRRVAGVLPMVDAIEAKTLVVAADCVGEASLLGRHQVRGVGSLSQLVSCLRGDPWPPPPPSPPPSPPEAGPDMSDIRGQEVGRTALEVCAAGGHHLLMSGPPGSGKTMLARRLPGLLPGLDPNEALEATRVRSAAGLPLPPAGLVERPPFRAPHHGASAVSLIGGGTSAMRPGEVSLAHCGVLFMDEMGEFPISVLNALRQPLEEGTVRVCRARGSVAFPARFLLVGATNPCPCGQGGPEGSCRCSDAARARYQRRFSGPLLDRFDLRIVVSRPDAGELLSRQAGEPSAVVAARVAGARSLARSRGTTTNAQIPVWRLDEVAPLTPGAASLLEHRVRVGSLSARGLHRVRRVARTIADLAGRPGGSDVPAMISEEHVCLALGLRAEVGPGELAA